MLNIKYLVFKKKPAKKLINWYIGLYIINKIVSTNVVKLWLLTSMKIHIVMNVSQVVRYREQVKKQKVEEIKLVEVNKVKE